MSTRKSKMGDASWRKETRPTMTPSRKSVVVKPKVRPDGEMYARPLPNPFTPEYMAGYNDGFDGRQYDSLKAGGVPVNYGAGYDDGRAQQVEDENYVDVTGSSNA